MSYKTSSEVREIFDIQTDDLKRLQNAGVLNPVRKGQGIASLFGDSDLIRVLEIKMRLLAGYRISEMGTLIKDKYELDDEISEQIHMYKKRIIILEFIRSIRLDIKKLEDLSDDHYSEIDMVSKRIREIYQCNNYDYNDMFWDYIKLVFIVDYLCQKESFADKTNIMAKKIVAAYQVIEMICRITNVEINTIDLKEFFVNIIETETDDNQIRELVQDFLQEIPPERERFIAEFMRESMKQFSFRKNSKVGKVYGDMMQHLCGFIFDYFIHEEELFCLSKNIVRFAKVMDKKALASGKIRIGG